MVYLPLSEDIKGIRESQYSTFKGSREEEEEENSHCHEVTPKGTSKSLVSTSGDRADDG